MFDRDDLYKFQNKAIRFFIDNDFCAGWLDLGLGKTVSALTAYSDLVSDFDAKRMLVAAPLRVARDVWADEVDQWSHLQGIEIAKITGTLEDCRKALKTPADIHTVSRERIPWLEEQFIQKKKQTKRFPWDIICLDEAQSFKNHAAIRTTSMKRMRLMTSRMIQLTGTPIPNGYMDLWAQIYLLDRGKRLGNKIGAYRDKYFDCETHDFGATYTLKAGAEEWIQERIRDIVISMRAEDYLDLPPVLNNYIRVRLSPIVMKKYRYLKREYVLKLAGGTITAANAGVLSSKLLQLANGAMYVGEKGEFELLHNTKIDTLLELLEGLTPPVLIAHGFVSDKVRIVQALKKYCRSDSQWSVLKSSKSLKTFAAGLIDYGVIHPGSAGHGLNDLHLSGAETIVWFGLTNNLEFYSQLNARLIGGHRRMGKNIVLHHIVADETVDSQMINLLESKEGTQIALARTLSQTL